MEVCCDCSTVQEQMRERIECKNNIIDDEQGGFRSGRGCVEMFSTLNQIGEKVHLEKANRV